MRDVAEKEASTLFQTITKGLAWSISVQDFAVSIPHYLKRLQKFVQQGEPLTPSDISSLIQMLLPVVTCSSSKNYLVESDIISLLTALIT